MTGSLWALVTATAVFLAIHIIPSSFMRSALVARVGTGAYLGGFSLLSAGAMIWMIFAYLDAPDGPIFWQFENSARYTAIGLMIVASVLFVSAYTSRNPTAIGNEKKVTDPAARGGIVAITRHPLMWSFVLWAIAHLLNNGDLRSIIFFGGFGLLAFLGTIMIDKKRAADLGEKWTEFKNSTSNIPFLAVFQGRAKLSISQLWWRVIAGFVLFMAFFHLHAW
ncbi:NnrU family protein, partial [Sneathiella glossodoripedis]|uniref:NnrU family protein n=1 Tax=Sneathiella glossodoripedis TaxID=418853 RepID=UPI00056A1DE3